MNCCENCFKDLFIKGKIKNDGKLGDCNFCSSKKVNCIDPSELEKYFVPVINIYTTDKIKIPDEEVDSIDGLSLWERIDDDWGTFSGITKENRGNLLNQIRKAEDNELLASYYGPNEVLVESESIWNEFCKELISYNRFFPSLRFDLELFRQLLVYLEWKIPANTFFYRSRISYDGKIFPAIEMGKPPVDKTKNGRTNPIGISYLYLASNIETAIAEIRPSHKDIITVGKFESLEKLSLIDLRNVSPYQFSEDEDFDALISYIGLLKNLNTALSRVISPRDMELEYIPTQYLCEFIKQNGWDGVAYKSSLADGYNIAIFADTKLQCVHSDNYDVGITKYSFKKK